MKNFKIKGKNNKNLFLGDGSSIFVSSQEEGEAGPASETSSGLDSSSWSSGSATYTGLVLNLRLYMIGYTKII
jgi:hypothetical protein